MQADPAHIGTGWKEAAHSDGRLHIVTSGGAINTWFLLATSLHVRLCDLVV